MFESFVEWSWKENLITIQASSYNCYELDQTFLNHFASILCTFQYCLLCSKTRRSHKSKFSNFFFYHREFFSINCLNTLNLYFNWKRYCYPCLRNRDPWCYRRGNNVTNETVRSGIECWIFKEMAFVFLPLTLFTSSIFP